MPTWSVPEEPIPLVVELTGQDAEFGPDVLLRAGDYVVTAAGDYALVEGVDAARQSIEREALASPGEASTLPAWGMGVAAAIARARTTSAADELRGRVTERLRANPRVTRVREVSVERFTAAGKPGIAVSIRAEVGSRDAQISFSLPGASTR